MLCCSGERYRAIMTLLFSPFSIAIISLGEERANRSAFRTFVRFVFVWICRFPIPLGVWEGLRFVIVALPGLFSYLILLFGDLWFILRGDLLYVLPCEVFYAPNVEEVGRAYCFWDVCACVRPSVCPSVTLFDA